MHCILYIHILKSWLCTVLNWTHGLSRTNTDVMAVYIRAQCWTEHKLCSEQILNWWLCTTEYSAELNTRSVQNKYWRDGCVHQSTVLYWTHGLSRTNTDVMAVCIRAQCCTEHSLSRTNVQFLCSKEAALCGTSIIEGRWVFRLYVRQGEIKPAVRDVSVWEEQ